MRHDTSSVSRCSLLVLAGTFAILPITGHALAEDTALMGTVNYRERMALPHGAVVIVQLVDISRADANADFVSEDRITGATGSPIAFRLKYDPSKIDLKRQYALQARIVAVDRLLFTNTSHHPIFSGGRINTRILVHRVSEKTDDRASYVGRWLAEDIYGGGVIDRLQTILYIAADGKVSGTGGCNRFTGRATIEGQNIKFGPLASTEMACTPAAMDQERKFFQALSQTRQFRLQPNEHKLILLDDTDKILVRFAAHSGNEPR